MLIAYWSVKGGSGTTVVAVAHALCLAGRGAAPVVIADLAGDVPAVLGVAEPTGPGLSEWVAGAGTDPGPLFERCTPAAVGVEVLHRGRAALEGEGRGDALAVALTRPPDAEVTVVVDCGLPRPGSPAWAVAAGAGQSIMVVRPCYLALRRAYETPLRPSSVVLVVEQGRALRRRDVEDTLGVPVAVEVPWDPAIARAVDAGLVIDRLPRLLHRAMRLGAVA